jgi:suppressor for copper-sensitivity B
MREIGRLRRFIWVRAVLALALIPGFEDGARAAATPWQGDAHAAARLITAATATGSASTVAAGLEIRLAPGWHSYWRSPGDAGIPPSLDWAGSKNLVRATISWPAPSRFSVQGFETAGYENHVVLPLALTLAEPGRPLELRGKVDYAACAAICVPYSARLDLALPAGPAAPAAEAPLIAAAAARVPRTLAAGGLRLRSATLANSGDDATLTLGLRAASDPFRAPDLFVEGLARGSPGKPEVTLRDGGRSANIAVPLRGTTVADVAGRELILTLVDGGRAAEFAAVPRPGPAAAAAGLLPILAIALVGGLILNVMPCVLPVVSLKLLAIAGQAGSERRRMRIGLLMTALGILASFAAIAAALIGLKEAGATIGWGIQFQWPWFVALLAAVTALFAASLWGWLPLALPRAIGDAAGNIRGRQRQAEAFLTGVFATLLATPCSAPFVGTAIGFALAAGPGRIALVFAAMGLGLAAPFLLVAAVPRLTALLPRPGRWLGTLRTILGFALAGTSLWLLFVLAALSGPRVAVVTAAALAAVLALLAARRRPGTPIAAARSASAAAAAIVIGAVLWPAFAGVEAPPTAASAGRWRPFDAAAVPRLVAAGKTVFVDVSAAWCLSCKVNEAAVLDREPVAGRLFASGVVAMRGDWTRPDPALTRYLESLGRYGIPFDAVYGPGRPEGETLPELLSADAVLRALDRAGGKPRADAAAAGNSR